MTSVLFTNTHFMRNLFLFNSANVTHKQGNIVGLKGFGLLVLNKVNRYSLSGSRLVRCSTN